MSEQVTFEKVKSNGSVVKKQVPVFRDGDWKEWLEWLLRLSEYFVFMGYTHSDEDQLDFVEDVQVLLQDDDLLMFSEIVAEEQLTSTNVALQALRRLTTVHCPPGTRALIMDELVQAKKTRTMTVREYARNFRKLLRMIPFVEENDPVPEADLTRMSKTGMPNDWQLELNRHARTWDLASMEAKFEAIERNEKEAEVLRSGRSMQRRQGEQQGKPTKTSKRHHQGSQQPDRSGKKTARSKPKQCTYCNKKGHLDTECFRNPNSPSYKPRGDHAGHQSRNTFAVMQEQVTQMAAMMEAMKKGQDEEFSAMRFYRIEEMSVFAVESTPLPSPRAMVDTQAPLQARRPVPATSVRSEPMMETEVLIGAHRFRALIDTGCSSSAIEETVVNTTKELLVLTRSEATYYEADKTVGITTHVATTQIALPVFSSTRVVVHDFRVVTTLHYPVNLGKDFLSRQGINLLFASKQLEWDGLTVLMAARLGERTSAALVAPDDSCSVEIAVDGTLEDAMVATLLEGTALTEAEQHDMTKLLCDFPIVCSGVLGRITGKPYVIGVTDLGRCRACRSEGRSHHSEKKTGAKTT